MKLEEKYDLELEKVVKIIKEKKHDKILLHLPDGLKPYATQIVDEIKKQTNKKPHVYLGSNFGACDIPIQQFKDEYDLIIHFGHTPWHRPYKEWGGKS